MSPEQTRGEELDARSDLFSLGVVLYEMATGSLPFSGSTPAVVFKEILTAEPTSPVRLNPQIPDELARIINRALEKDKGFRYQSAKEMLAELKRLKRELDLGSRVTSATAKSKELPSIAVLPFLNMSADPENEYFGDGLAEELINALAKLKGLRVAPRSSAFSTKGTGKSIAEVGRELRVSSVLEGSIRTFGDRIRVTAQLVKIEDGYPLWSERFDRQMDDIFAIQDEICLAIVDNLKVRLLSQEREKLEVHHTVNQEAYRLYLKGRYFWDRRHQGGMQQALTSFQRAIEVDPLYAEPYVGLADAYGLMAHFGFARPQEACPKALAAAGKALELDEGLGSAHVSLAWHKMIYDWDWGGAETEFKLGLELSPDYATGHEWYALFLANVDKDEEAATHMSRALELDPLSLPIQMAAAIMHNKVTGIEKSEQIFRKALEMDPEFTGVHLYRAFALGMHGRFEESIRSSKQAIARLGRQMCALGYLGWALGRSRQAEVAKEILDEMDEIGKKEGPGNFFFKALVELGLGRREQCLNSLEAATAVRGSHLWGMGVFPGVFGELYDEPRFQEIRKRVGFSNYKSPSRQTN
jgi:serine/threonine-protein kinase